MENHKNKQLVITFSQVQTAKYLEIVSGKLASEIDTESLPSGARIVIEVVPPFGSTATVNGTEIGEVAIDIIEAHHCLNT